MSAFDFDALFAGMVDRGELRIETLPDGSPTYRQTARGAEVYREGMRRIASGEDLLMQLEEVASGPVSLKTAPTDLAAPRSQPARRRRF